MDKPLEGITQKLSIIINMRKMPFDGFSEFQLAEAARAPVDVVKELLEILFNRGELIKDCTGLYRFPESSRVVYVSEHQFYKLFRWNGR